MTIHLTADSPRQDWEGLRPHLTRAKRVAVLTGAGVSAESGLRTFRAGGLWEDHRVEDVATPEAFERDPGLVWRFYNARRAALFAARPNPGHFALARLEERLPGTFTLATQNVDGLHLAAGSENVLELHGSLARVRCSGCTYRETTSAALPELPRCACGAPLRPDIVWFGEMLAEDVILEAQRAAGNADVFVVAGTSAVVFPAAGLISLARRAGAFVVEVNPEATDASHLAHATLRGAAGAMLPKLAEVWVGA